MSYWHTHYWTSLLTSVTYMALFYQSIKEKALPKPAFKYFRLYMFISCFSIFLSIMFSKKLRNTRSIMYSTSSPWLVGYLLVQCDIHDMYGKVLNNLAAAHQIEWQSFYFIDIISDAFHAFNIAAESSSLNSKSPMHAQVKYDLSTHTQPLTAC